MIKNKGETTVVSKRRTRDQLTDIGPLRPVFLISKIDLTGNLGTIIGKAETHDFLFFYCNLDLAMVCRTAHVNSEFTQCKAIML